MTNRPAATRSRRLRIFFVALSLSATALAPAAKADPKPDPKPQKTLTFRLISEPETLDWNRAHTEADTYVLMNLMEGLLDFDAKMRPRAALAESWSLDKTGTVYTFKIRRNVHWTDGRPLRAQDFAYSWKRLLSPLTAANYSYLLFDVIGAEDFHSGRETDFGKVGIQALDDWTLQVSLKHRVAYWLYIPTFWVTFPLREDVIAAYGESWATPGRMVTLGPYSLYSHEFGSEYVLKTNPTYYRAKGNLDAIVAKIVPDDSVALKMYDSGQLDLLVGISGPDPKTRNRPDLRAFPYLKTTYLGFQTDAFPTGNVHIRRAVAMAIDRSKLPALLQGRQTPGTSFVPPGVLGYSSHGGLPFDVLRARRELSIAGLDPTSLKLNLISTTGQKPQAVMAFIQSELQKNLGISVTTENRDYKQLFMMLDLKTYPAFLLNWGADYPDPDNFFSIFLNQSGNNHFGWKNDEYEKLVLGGRETIDQRKREADYLAAQKILLEDDAVIVPLFYEPNLVLLRAGFSGVDLNPLNYLMLGGASRRQ